MGRLTGVQNRRPSLPLSFAVIPLHGGHDCYMLNPVSLIARKRDGQELAPVEIAEFLNRYTRGEIVDYQVAAFLMAVYLRGMTPSETAALTDTMLHSGRVLTWPSVRNPVADKHSTGGLGDKVSLILAPLLASCGVHVPMISGRGLGPTGGTLDKLEAIPGFRTDLSLAEVHQITNEVGCVITGATAELAPADKKLYALRDVTATVASIPLITASIMSKKLAEGIDALVLDVKFGSGAFMKTLAQARELAESMVATGQRMRVNTIALLTDMNQPLGRMVGNAVEVDESLDVLAGGGPEDVWEVTVALGAEVLVATEIATDLTDARLLLNTARDTGDAMAKFREMVAAQGGRLDAPRPRATATELHSPASGYIAAIDTESLGFVVINLGGGRKSLSDRIDHSVGLEMLVRLGDEVVAGQPLMRVYAAPDAADRVWLALVQAFTISTVPPAEFPLIAERVIAVP